MRGGKTARINIRVTESELKAIKHRSRAAGLTSSEYVRRAALADANRPVIRTDVETLQRTYANLRRSGNLLNQCARELNTHHRPEGIETELRAALHAVALASEDISGFIADARKSI